MFRTVFDKYAKRVAKGGPYWMLIIAYCLLFIIGSAVLTKGKYFMIPGGLLLIPVLLFRKKKTENITFFVKKDAGNNFRFGYVNLDYNKEEFSLDAYTYWTRKKSASESRAVYELYMRFSYKQHFFYLQETKTLEMPPRDWPEEDETIPDKAEQFIVPDLEELALLLDKENE